MGPFLITLLICFASFATAHPYNSSNTLPTVTFSATRGIPVNTIASGSCGQDSGLCPSGQCCSKFGYCGNTTAYCGAGCQPSYGNCNTDSSAIDTSYAFSYQPLSTAIHHSQITITETHTKTSVIYVPASGAPSSNTTETTTNSTSSTSPAFSFSPLISSSVSTPSNTDFTGATTTVANIALPTISLTPSSGNTTTSASSSIMSSVTNTTSTGFTFAPLSTPTTTTGAISFEPLSSTYSVHSARSTVTLTLTRTLSPIPFSSNTLDSTSV